MKDIFLIIILFRASKISLDLQSDKLRVAELSLQHREKLFQDERDELYQRINKLTSEVEHAESKWVRTNSSNLQMISQLQAEVDLKNKQLKIEVNYAKSILNKLQMQSFF